MKHLFSALICVWSALLLTSCSGSIIANGKLERSFAYSPRKTLDDKAFDEALQSGAKVNVHFSNGATPLIMAVLRNRPDRVEKLLKKGADVSFATKQGTTALHTAAALSRMKCVELLLQAGANPDKGGAYGRTALMEAARTGDLEILKKLLEKRSSIHAVDHLGRTALMHGACAQKNSLKTVQYLVSKGADPMVYDKELKLAVMHAAELHHTDSALYLLDLIQDLPKRPALGLMIMHSAIKGGDLKMVETLIDRRIPLNRDPSLIFKGTRLLKTRRIYQILVRNGILARSRTPIHWAAIANNKQIVQLLIRRGADPLQMDEAADTADELTTSPEVRSYIRECQKKILKAKKK